MCEKIVGHFGDLHGKMDELYSRVSDGLKQLPNYSDEQVDQMIREIDQTVKELYFCWELEKLD